MSDFPKNIKFDDFITELVDSSDCVYKMAWEQVLLLCIYSRQQLMEQSTILIESNLNFWNKLRLVELLWTARTEEEIEEYKKEYEELRDGILQRIEEYNDIHQITDYLMSISNNEENKTSSGLAKSFLKKIAERHISFSDREPYKNHKHPYSYYAMYRSLTEALSTFRKILELDFSKESISECIFRDIRNQFYIDRFPYSLDDRDSIAYEFKQSLRKTKSAEEAFTVMEKYSDSIPINLTSVLIKARSALTKKIGTDLYEIFSVFQKNIITNGIFSKTFVSPFDTMVKCEHDSGEITLKIDSKSLEKLKSLGNFDGVIDAIRRKIDPDNAAISPRERYTHPSTDKNSILDVANWYKQVKTPLFVKVTDCPSLVASILEFDSYYDIGIFNEAYGSIILPFEKKKWFSKDGYLLVTAIIQSFLYKNNPVPISCQHSHLEYNESDSYIKNLTKYVTEELCQSQNILDNKIMKDWANLSFDENLTEELPEYIAMINRFKRLPIYLKAEEKIAKKIESSNKSELKTHGNKKIYIWSVRILIEKQIEDSKKESYPLDSSFPLPLWV